MKITKIEQQKKNKDKFSIYIDGEYLFSLHDELIYRYKLKEGISLDSSFISEVLKTEEQKRANEYLIKLLSSSSKTEKEIIDKMKNKGFEDEQINNSIKLMKEYSYIDDDRYAKYFTKDSATINKMGINKIKTKLYQKGVDKEIINEAINEVITDEQQYEAALEIGLKKYKNIKEEDNRKKGLKLISFLQYRGYSLDIIKMVLRAVENELADEIFD